MVLDESPRTGEEWSTFTRESRRTTEDLLKSIVGGQVVEEVVAETEQQFHVPVCLFSFFPFPPSNKRNHGVFDRLKQLGNTTNVLLRMNPAFPNKFVVELFLTHLRQVMLMPILISVYD